MELWLSQLRYRRNVLIAALLGRMIDVLVRAMPSGHAGKYSLMPNPRKPRKPTTKTKTTSLPTEPAN